ncbi:MAG: hypothetical protein QXP36_09840 [Conexivisphaerales archaeon]
MVHGTWEDGLFKEGRQFKFPKSLMKWLVVWKQFVDCRVLEGITRKIYQFGLIPEYPDYTTIYTRISDLVPEISLPEFDEVEIATDDSGLKTSNVGKYRIL